MMECERQSSVPNVPAAQKREENSWRASPSPSPALLVCEFLAGLCRNGHVSLWVIRELKSHAKENLKELIVNHANDA